MAISASSHAPQHRIQNRRLLSRMHGRTELRHPNDNLSDSVTACFFQLLISLPMQLRLPVMAQPGVHLRQFEVSGQVLFIQLDHLHQLFPGDIDFPVPQVSAR